MKMKGSDVTYYYIKVTKKLIYIFSYVKSYLTHCQNSSTEKHFVNLILCMCVAEEIYCLIQDDDI
jgi:hypothetical protein